MNTKIICIIFSFLFSSICFSNIFVYPNFFGTNIVSNSDAKISNDKYESELYNNEEENIEIKVLSYDWFGFMNEHFTKYVTTKVIDILSGQRYYVQRLGGYNHADVQTIDKQNTQIFKSVYNGEWSWERRPVWVEIDGQYFAGSTNGMPHGFDILQTGEGGHTCIHFLNSKTHGTKRVDEAHQKCISYAQKNETLLKEYLKK